MQSLNRRKFLSTGLLSTIAIPTAPLAACAADESLWSGWESPEGSSKPRVVFSGDGLGLTAVEYAQLLARLCDEQKLQRDVYCEGGPVAELEKHMASVLGKEHAVFLPTGTLANNLAIRLLAGERRRVLVQRESHLYKDEGDFAQLLSGLTLVPLAADRSTFSLQEVEAEMRGFDGGPLPVPVGAISIESPVRRKSGEVFDLAEMKKISAFARARKIGLHLDGARLFLASAYTGISPAEYSALFDTVYVSLYKYFNAGAGAILAGPRSLLENMAFTRRQFGGGMFQAWQYAAVALHFAKGFDHRFKNAVQASEVMLRKLSEHPRFRVERIPSGSNVFALHFQVNDLKAAQKKLADANIFIRDPQPSGKMILMNVNETLNRRPPEELAQAFISAVG
jgi:threonine aldolase